MEEIIHEIAEIDLTTLSFFGIPASTLITILAVVLLVVMIARGYRRGVIAELSPVLALAACVAAVYLAAPFVRRFVPLAWGRAGRAAVFFVLILLVYGVAHLLLKTVGEVFRRIPLIGFLTGILGAFCGAAEAVCLLLLIQKAFEINLLRSILYAAEQFV